MKYDVFKTKKDINDIKIGILADIHYYPNFSKRILDKLLKQINDENPNYLVIAGDILDSSNCLNIDGIIDFFKDINNNIKILLILGNHDMHYKRKGKVKYINDDFVKAIKKIDNVVLLRDDNYIDNNICFYGFDLDVEHYYKQREKYSDFEKRVVNYKPNFNNKNYNILLFHSPANIYTYIANNPDSLIAKTDLIISGHMHNGLIPYSITNLFNKLFKDNHSLISPSRSLFPNYSQGRVYKIRDGIIYEGLSKLSKSSGFFHYFDFIYHKKVKFITIKHFNS